MLEKGMECKRYVYRRSRRRKEVNSFGPKRDKLSGRGNAQLKVVVGGGEVDDLSGDHQTVGRAAAVLADTRGRSTAKGQLT